MSHYSVTLERSEPDVHLAWVHELPGCVAYGATRDEALARVPQAIEQFRGWLRAAGEKLPAEDIHVDQVALSVVGEAGRAEQTSEGPDGVLLTWDEEPLAPEEWTRIERWLQQSRRELLDVLEQMPEDQLGTAARDGARTIWQQLRHIATVEFMYALWTFDFRTKRDLRALLEWTRQMAFGRMRALAEQRDRQLTYADWAGTGHPEPWSARKAARRLVYHELWHLRSIRRLLQGLRGREASGAPR